jgi:ankyrin repeat protein
VRALIENGADFNYQKKVTLLTPLHWAAYNNDFEVLKLLISKGADLKFSDLLESPLTVAGNCKNFKVITFFNKMNIIDSLCFDGKLVAYK